MKHNQHDMARHKVFFYDAYGIIGKQINRNLFICNVCMDIPV